MQLDPRSRRRIGSTPERTFSPGPLRYKVEKLSEQETDPMEAAASGVGELPPLNWGGKPIESLRSLLSDYAPLMTEKEAFLWLLFVVALCGINFPLTKYVGESFDGPTLLTSRFAIAAVCFAPWFRDIKMSAIPAGVETGAWLAAGYIAQAVCLMGGTNSGVASFFASMSCVLCPFFERVVGVKLGWRAWAAAATGLLSAFVLELGPGLLDGSAGAGGAAMHGPTVSDLVGLLQPALFGLYLFRTELAMKRLGESEAMPLTAVQVLVTAAICGAWGSSQALAGAGGLPELGEFLFAGLGDMSGLKEKVPAILGLLWMGVLPSGLSLALETVIVHKLSSSVTVSTLSLGSKYRDVRAGFGLCCLKVHAEARAYACTSAGV